MKVLSIAGDLLAQWQPGYPGYQGPWGWHSNMMMGGGWGIFMFIFMLIFLALIIGAVVLLVRYLSPHSPQSRPRASSEDALEILRRRYARGEIQKAEFEEKRKDLEA